MNTNEEVTVNNLAKFIKNAREGLHPLFFESEKIPRKRYSEKLVGEDFVKRVIEQDENWLVYFQHPVKGKYSSS